MKVIVIGAGTGGLCLAHGLKQSGIDVAVYERDRTRRDGLQGYRVGIDPDGNRALHACLPKDLFDTFVATCARAPRYGNMLTERLTEMLSLDSGPVSTDPLKSEKSVSRMTMRQVLLTGMEDVVHFGKVFTRYTHEDDGTVTAHFEDGTTATGDLLVAADGSNSRVRRQYLPHARLEDSGLVGVTGKLLLTEETRRLLPPKVIEGVSMVFAPGGYNCVLHVMEFKWDHAGELKNGIGGDDAELLAAWPGLNFDNTRDYIMWGFAGATRNLPADVLSRKGPELHRMVTELTGRWHPNLRKLFAMTDPTTCFPLSIRTSVPIPQWETSNVTLLGDAIHTMTPGRGVGANTALRDAALLRRNLVAVRDGEKGLLEAVRGYETKMIEYGFDAVVKSRQQMSGDDPIHRPVLGRLMLAVMRTGMRVVNHLPPVKRRMAEAQARYRGADRDDF
ncbi:FAD-dependent oxidoreductase [Streptosporangium sp. NPDC000396]|uniref:FAD-dependent oxidoreductase n=1 Tax=Streptosporangium sp. NPDC000396 TaxID=3366185 RepID=UPI003692164A